jgi:outer membrane protein
MKFKARNIFLFTAALCFLHYSNGQNLSLEQCITQGIQNHPSIKGGKLQVELASTNTVQAKSNRLPSLGAGVSQSANFGRSIDRFTNAYIDQIYNSTYAGVQVSMPLYTSMANIHSIEAAKEMEQASGQGLEVLKNQIKLEVTRWYLTALAQKELIASARSQYKNDSLQYSRTLSRKAAGISTALEEIQINQQLKNDEAAIIDSKLNYEISLVNLYQAMNLPLQKEIMLETVNSTANANIISTSNFDHLPEIKQLQNRIAAQRYNIKAINAQKYPSVTLNGGYGSFFASSNAQRSFLQQFNDTRNGNLALNLNIPIMGRWAVNPRVANAKIQEQIIENSIENNKLQLQQQLNAAISNLQNLTKKYENAMEQKSLSESAVATITQQLNAGTVTMVDYVLAQTNVEKANATVINTKYMLIYQQKLIQLLTLGN